MRVGPGLTLWGPLAEGERAELFGDSVEQLIDALRSAADVIFADTSCFWGDAVAVAVGACDRCLVEPARPRGPPLPARWRSRCAWGFPQRA